MLEKNSQIFIEIAYFQQNKYRQVVCGDTFLSRKIVGDNRFVAVLSDGLGSGIKANVLSTMTASMALNFRLRREPVLRSALNIMNALPIDSVRNISYATFTIVDVDFQGNTHIVEFDSPPYLFFREQDCVQPRREKVEIAHENQKYMAYVDLSKAAREERATSSDRVLMESHLKLFKGDRIIFYSDGVNQSGMGSASHPFGWGDAGVIQFIKSQLSTRPDISGRDLSKMIVNQALLKDGMKSRDDISCAVIYCREPRKLLISTGPPYDGKKDRELADRVANFKGKTIICGGTTSKIIARELGREITVDLKNIRSSKYPPAAQIEGVSLVTEGIITLGAVSEMLENPQLMEKEKDSPAVDIIHLIEESDIIELLVGTRINEAHQDPSLPVELEIRRNVIKRIASVLEEKWLKKVKVNFI